MHYEQIKTLKGRLSGLKDAGGELYFTDYLVAYPGKVSITGGYPDRFNVERKIRIVVQSLPSTDIVCVKLHNARSEKNIGTIGYCPGILLLAPFFVVKIFVWLADKIPDNLLHALPANIFKIIGLMNNAYVWHRSKAVF